MHRLVPLGVCFAFLFAAGACASTSIGPGFCDPMSIDLPAPIDTTVLPVGTTVIGGICADLCPASKAVTCRLASASSIECSAGCP